MPTIEKTKFRFNTDWFSSRVYEWDQILPFIKMRDRILEIGSFQGESACWFLEHVLSDRGELYCIDTWQGSAEIAAYIDRPILEAAFETFKSNVTLAKRPQQRIELLKGTSICGLSALLANQQNTFDLIYVDAAHDAVSVLTDACMAWPLLRSGGVMVFDDYTWGMDSDLDLIPKPAIDSFFIIFRQQLIPLFCGSQFAVKKK